MTIFLFDNKEGEAFQFCESSIDTKTGDVIFEEPEPNAGTFYIRSMGRKLEELQSKQKKRVEHVLNPKTRKMDRIVYFEDLTPEEDEANSAELWDHVITGWDDKVLDGKGRKIPISKENKMRLMEIPAFDRFVGRCLRHLSNANVKHDEELEKNLSSGSSGKKNTSDSVKAAE